MSGEASPFAPDTFHARLASIEERDLRLELGLRWAYGLAHAIETGADPHQYMRELSASFRRDITHTLELELPIEFAKQYARDFAAAVAL